MAHLPENEIVGTTFYTIDNILAFGNNGPDALALYFKYIEQSRIQSNTNTYSLDVFMMQKMGWGELRLRKSKNILKELGLIDKIQTKNAMGQITGTYIRVNFMISEDKVRSSSITYDVQESIPLKNQAVDFPLSGEGETNTFILNTNTLLPKINTCEFDFETFWKSFPHSRKAKKSEAKKEFMKQDSKDVFEEVKLLNRKIEIGLQDTNFIPACERWIRDFVKTSDIVRESVLEKAIKYLSALEGEKRREVSSRLKLDYGEEYIKGLWDKYNKRDGIKLIFKDDNGKITKFIS